MAINFCEASLNYYSETELLSYLLPKQKALKVMETFSSFQHVIREDYHTLKKIAGLTVREYTRIKAPSLLLERGSKAIIGEKIRQPDDVYRYYSWLRHEKVESGFVLGLDAKNRVKFEERIALGTINAAVIDSRTVFHPAIKYLVSAIILLHNHPSGGTVPSSQDVALTKKLVKSGEILNVSLLDHIIFGDGYLSLKQGGFM